jgi:uncharacterized phage-associated protein
MSPVNFKIDDRRFKDLILYVSARLQDDPSFGETKLNKILFFSDFESFRLRGEPITGAEYQRNHHGPTARIFTILRNQMVNADEITTDLVEIGGYRQTVVRPLIDPTTEFTQDEREIIDGVIEKMRKYTNKEVSDKSHEFAAGWRAMEQGQTIPYSSAIIDPTPLPDDLLAKLRELVTVS